MTGTTGESQSRVIVVPRALEGFFYERLNEHFSNREDIDVVVDRRSRDRRNEPHSVVSRPSRDRRRGQRRRVAPAWVLADIVNAPA